MAGKVDPGGVLDEITAAQQYVLDLQVLFYSLKTVAANGQKAGTSSEAEAATADSKPARDNAPKNGVDADSRAGAAKEDGSAGGAAGQADAAALQSHLEGLRLQLEEERAERARLQEQLVVATDLLRKSYGQIVDDYLFATEQLHLRTRQLEGLLARQPAAGTATEQSVGAGAEAGPPDATSSGRRPAGHEVRAQDSAAWLQQAAAAQTEAAALTDTQVTATATDVAHCPASSTSERASSSGPPDAPWGSSPASGQSRDARTASGHGTRGGCEEAAAEVPVGRDAAEEPEGSGSGAQQQPSGAECDALLQEHQSAPQPRTQRPAMQHPHPEGSGGHDHLELPAPRRRSEVTVWAVASPPASSPIREASDTFASSAGDAMRPAAASTFAAAAAAPPLAAAASPYGRGAYPSPGLASLFAGADSAASTPPPNYPPSIAASTCSPFSMPASYARVFGAGGAGGVGATAVITDAAAGVAGASPAGLSRAGVRSERPSVFGGSNAVPMRLFHSAEDESAWGAPGHSAAPAAAFASVPRPHPPAAAPRAADASSSRADGAATAGPAAARGGGGGPRVGAHSYRGDGGSGATAGGEQEPQSRQGPQRQQPAHEDGQEVARSPVHDNREGPSGKRLRRSVSSPIEDPAALWRHLPDAADGSLAADPVRAAAASARATSAAPLRPGPPLGEQRQVQHPRRSAQGPSLSSAGKQAAASARGHNDGSPQLRGRREPGVLAERASAMPPPQHQQHSGQDAQTMTASQRAPGAAARRGGSSSPRPTGRQRSSTAATAAAAASGAQPAQRADSSPAARSRSHSTDNSADGSGIARGHGRGNGGCGSAALNPTATGQARGVGSGNADAGSPRNAQAPAPTDSSGSAGGGGGGGGASSGLSYSSSLDGLASMVRDLRQQLEGLQREFRRGDPGDEEAEQEEEGRAAGGYGVRQEREDEEDEDGVADSGSRWARGLFTPDSSAAKGAAYGYRGGMAAEEEHESQGGLYSRQGQHKDAAAGSSSASSSNSSRPAPAGGFSPYSPYSPNVGGTPYTNTYYDTASSSAGTSPAPGPAPAAPRHSSLPHGIDISPVAAYLREQRQHQHQPHDTHAAQTAKSGSTGGSGARREPASHFAPSAAPRTFSGAKAGAASATRLRSPLQDDQAGVNRFRTTAAAASQPGKPNPVADAYQAMHGDRSLPQDQTGPRKVGTAAPAAAHKAPAGPFQAGNHIAAASAAAAGCLRAGMVPGEPFFPPSSMQQSWPGSGRAGQHRTGAPPAAAAVAAADSGPASTADLQGLRSEAMFARIKQQLDELQSSFTQTTGVASAAVGPAPGTKKGTGLGLGVERDVPMAGLRRS
ncbi:hypothetical protein HYH02_002842 [Chlamydomonas schloesseri]|uniref:Uncharacterized protein n=1 Tax=Chlamydomonas schloesseri TaxID=2026947 RepID=A0A835WS07_9CHLO|nr:hypothetical protein HYH02_002842 [Chlamydomonas schloesseri]|eukprot:KAG2452605.1 hypothetical protein HYH02_002842 [Chlamydomonas schloesseri]